MARTYGQLVSTPATNGFVERMNRILVDECVRVAGRTTWSLKPAEIQRDQAAQRESLMRD